MGTRGFVGFHIGGSPKVTYNHFDSYPSGLGLEVLAWARKVEENRLWGTVRHAAADLTLVKDDDQPPLEAIEALKDRYGDPTVGAQGMANTVIRTWYQLLRGAQGDLDAILECGYMIDSSEFPLDGLFCEWGYLVNLDGDGSFEVYKGFETAEHDRGVWGTGGTGRPQGWQPEKLDYTSTIYYPVARVASWPLFNLPDDATFIAATDPEED